MNSKPNPKDTPDTSKEELAQPSSGPLKNEPTPERAREEKKRQEEAATKKS